MDDCQKYRIYTTEDSGFELCTRFQIISKAFRCWLHHRLLSCLCDHGRDKRGGFFFVLSNHLFAAKVEENARRVLDHSQAVCIGGMEVYARRAEQMPSGQMLIKMCWISYYISFSFVAMVRHGAVCVCVCVGSGAYLLVTTFCGQNGQKYHSTKGRENNNNNNTLS